MRRILSRMFFKILTGILILMAAIIVIWITIAGPVTMYRVLSRGDTTIYDYKRFPGRNLSASPAPFHFNAALQPEAIPKTVYLEKSGKMKLEELLTSSRTIAFLVIKDDVILDERYYLGHQASDISQIFSTSKSILSILIGTAIDDGLIHSVKDPVTVYIPELADAGFEKVTVENLLNMQSNLDYFENDNPFGEHVIFNFTDQLENEILGLRLLSTPDKQFRYKSGDNALLGLILDRALGTGTITQYMQERLWNPLGMEDRGVWGVDRPDGLERTWCCLSVSARDLARFGRLYLRNGDWNGMQIVSSEWVKNSTTVGAYQPSEWPADLSASGALNYKYQWWLLPDNDYSTWGKDGQYMYLNPEKNLIIIRLGETTGDLPWFAIFQQIAEQMH